LPNRVIKESLCESEKIASLSDFEFRLWIGLILHVDDAGRGDARPAIIKGHVFPLRDRVTTKDIDAAIHALAAKGCVSLYEIGGKPYFWFPSWANHQRIRDVRPRYPEPPAVCDSAADCGELRQTAADCGELPQIAADCGSRMRPRAPAESESNPNPNTNPKGNTPARHKYGAYGNVLLSDEEMDKLKAEFPEDWQQRIERLSEYMASKGTGYKNHLATIRAWAKKDAERPQKPQPVSKGPYCPKDNSWMEAYLK